MKCRRIIRNRKAPKPDGSEEPGAAVLFCCVYSALKRQNILQDRKGCEPAEDRCDRNGRKIVGDLDLCDTDDIGAQCNDNKRTDAGHLCNGRSG